MDNNYNQQTNGNPYQQGNFSKQQGNTYQQQQGNPYQQQGNPYQQQGNVYQQGTPYMGNGYGNNGDNAEPQKAPNIFQQFALAFVPTKYSRLTKVKTGSMIGFVTLLVLIATVLSFISIEIALASLNIDEWADVMPDFEITNGHLYLDEEFMYDERPSFVYMTEDVDMFSYEDAAELAAEGYQAIILVGRDGISVMQNGEYQQLDFGDVGSSLEISRDWIVETIVPVIMVMMVFIYLLGFVFKCLGYFLFAAVYLLFAMLIASVMNKNLETGELFRVAVYSKVLMFVVSTLYDLLPFTTSSVPFLLKVAITIGFMAFAIAKLPDNRPIYTAPMMPGAGQWQGYGPNQGGQGQWPGQGPNQNGQGWQ